MLGADPSLRFLGEDLETHKTYPPAPLWGHQAVEATAFFRAPQGPIFEHPGLQGANFESKNLPGAWSLRGAIFEPPEPPGRASGRVREPPVSDTQHHFATWQPQFSDTTRHFATFSPTRGPYSRRVHLAEISLSPKLWQNF